MRRGRKPRGRRRLALIGLGPVPIRRLIPRLRVVRSLRFGRISAAAAAAARVVRGRGRNPSVPRASTELRPPPRRVPLLLPDVLVDGTKLVQDLDEDARDVEELGGPRVSRTRAVRLVRLSEELQREVLQVQLVLLPGLRQPRRRLRRLQLLQELAEELGELRRALRRPHALFHGVHAAVVGHLGVGAGHLVRALEERRQRLDVRHVRDARGKRA
mmetsp:Transcript_10568/g.41275  ORF Transcript_10568/g.41275 Transcript_10568/m.41275 type:complete len:215 (+) Transcript_10568:1291-1935(+)